MALLAPQRLDPRRQGDTFRPDLIRWILTDDDFSELQLAIKSCTVVVVDLETTGLDPYATFGGSSNGGYPARIVLASFTLPREDEEGEEPTTYVLPLSHPDSPWLGSWRRTLGRVAEQIAASARPVVNANVKFDAKWIYAHTRVDLSALIVWDTQVSSHLLDETESTRLKERVPATFGVQRWDDFDLSKPGAAERVALFDLGGYAARDTYWTWRLYELHIWLMNISEPEEPDDPDALELARVGRLATYVAMPTVRSLTAIEQRGFRLDVDWVREHLAECQDTSRALIDKLSTRYGMDPATASFAPTSKWFLAWTEAAMAAGDLIIGGLTATGRPQWDKAVLVRQSRAGSDVATDLLEMRGAIKRAEYLTSWLGQVTPAGKIHATYHAGRVVTGRLSSCVTADTLIDMPRDMVKYPHGVPITEVKAGDWVYSFDWRRELTLRQVEWVGQTGVRPTVVVTFENSEGHRRVLRCTPEHLVRLRNGDWRPAGSLLRNRGRGEETNPRVMAMVRRGFDTEQGYLYFFPHSIARGNGMSGGGRSKEHRWVAERVFGKRLSTKIDVHHVNGTKVDNTPSNLLDLTMSEHRALGHGHARYGEVREVPEIYRGPNDYRVVSVEDGPTEPVWDMTVPEDHQFIANGIVVHNSDPNMQQVTKSLKPAFVPRPGNVIAELDFSQIELRVAAFISRCEPMLEAFRQGHDLHRLLGARLTGKAPEDVTPEERQAAKSANFGLLYQMSAAGFQTYAETVYGVTFTADEAAAVRQAFYDMWDGIGAWHMRSIKKARMTGQIVSPIGRVRRLPDINSYNDRLVGWSERSAVNSPVQGFASDLMQLSAAWIGGFAPGHAPVWDAEIVATVHDSIVIEAPADRWEPIVRECMSRMVRVGELLTGLDCTLDVPLAVEAKVGSRWGLADIGTVES